MHRLIYILLLLGAVHLASCSRDGGAIAEMERAESLMDSLPDSSLAVMRGIDPRTLRSSEARALYALTMSRALDRCDSFIASDSIIAPAVAYYRADRDPLRHTMTQYYLGRTRFHAGDYPNSIIAYLSGLETAEHDSLFFWAGMNARGVKQNFNRTYNGGHELEYAGISYDYFAKSAKKAHRLYALLDKGLALLNNNRQDESTPIFEQVAEEALECEDYALWAEAMNCLANSAYGAGDNRKAIETVRQLIDADLAKTEDSVYMAAAYANIGRLDSAKALSKMLENSKTHLGSEMQYLIYKSENNTNKALKALNKVCEENTEFFYNRYNNDLTFDVVDYYDSQRIIKEEKLKSSNRLVLFIGLISLLLIVVIVLLYAYLHNRLIRQRENYALLAEELRQSNNEATAGRQMAREEIFSLFKNHYGLVDELCRGYYENATGCPNYKQIEKTISETVKSFAEKDEGFKEAEAIAIKYYGKIFEDIRADIPNLSVKEYQLLVYSSLGLSTTAIAMFVENGKINNVYNRKRHLKDKIKALNSDKSELYLKFLG